MATPTIKTSAVITAKIQDPVMPPTTLLNLPLAVEEEEEEEEEILELLKSRPHRSTKQSSAFWYLLVLLWD